MSSQPLLWPDFYCSTTSSYQPLPLPAPTLANPSSCHILFPQPPLFNPSSCQARPFQPILCQTYPPILSTPSLVKTLLYTNPSYCQPIQNCRKRELNLFFICPCYNVSLLNKHHRLPWNRFSPLDSCFCAEVPSVLKLDKLEEQKTWT